MKNRIIISLLLICSVITVQAQKGWKEYRGPERSAQVEGQLSTNAEGKIVPELVWKKELGPGFSEINIDGNTVFTQYGEFLDSITGLEYLVALNAQSGKEVWKTIIDSIYIEKDKWGDGPRSTPAIDGNTIYCLSGLGNLAALDKGNGKIKWTVDLPEKYGSTMPRWGFSSSPIIIDDMLILEVGGTENRAVVAFNKANGEQIWTKGSGPSGYNSPLYTTIDGQKQLIFAIGGVLQSFTPAGDTLWKARIPIGNLIAMPIQLSEKRFYLSNAGRGYLVADLEDGTLKEVKKGMTMKNDFMTSVLYDGHIYGYHIAALKCLDPETGETKWQKRGFGKGSLMMVGDKLVILSDKGKLAIANATPEAYQEIGSVQAMDRSRAWTSPSYDQGRIYVRNLKEIACYKLK